MKTEKKSWAALINSLKKFTADFMGGGRSQPPVQNRGREFYSGFTAITER